VHTLAIINQHKIVLIVTKNLLLTYSQSKNYSDKARQWDIIKWWHIIHTVDYQYNL